MRRRNLENQFTYGFEAEGMFSHTLELSIQKQMKDLGEELDQKDDGSVSVKKDEGKSGIAYTDDREWAVGVFKGWHSFMDMLKQFTYPHYIQNDSCGLHIHIAPKGNPNKEQNVKLLMSDRQLINDVQAWAFENLCTHIKGERSTNFYCQKYPKKYVDFRQLWDMQDKFRFVRNHP